MREAWGIFADKTQCSREGFGKRNPDAQYAAGARCMPVTVTADSA